MSMDERLTNPKKSEKIGDFFRQRSCAVPPAAAADVRENGTAAPPHSSIPHGRGAHALAPPVPLNAPEKSGLQDEPEIGALR
jgi:hypothetical protein